MADYQVVKKGSTTRAGYKRTYVGRGTALGNAFSHLEQSRAEVQVASRDAAVEAADEWLEVLLEGKITENPAVLALLSKLTPAALEVRRTAVRKQLNSILALGDSVELECYCAPLRCHATPIAARLDQAKINDARF